MIVLVYYRMGLIFICLAILPVGNVNIVLSKLILRWVQHVTKLRQTGYQTGFKQANNLARLSKAAYLEVNCVGQLQFGQQFIFVFSSKLSLKDFFEASTIVWLFVHLAHFDLLFSDIVITYRKDGQM